MTHRMFARNTASSRAIPIGKMRRRIRESPVIPIKWGKNQKGMQGGDELVGWRRWAAQKVVQTGLYCGLAQSWALDKLGCHKQIANRYTEPWMWITAIATGNGTAFENFFKLRCHPDAEPHIAKIAYMLRDEYDASTPNPLAWGEWHLPLTGFEGDELLTQSDLVKVCVGRCARISYLTHDGRRDVSKDIGLHDRLVKSGHWSPFEHAAQAMEISTTGGCLGPTWHMYRKEFKHEVCKEAPRVVGTGS